MTTFPSGVAPRALRSAIAAIAAIAAIGCGSESVSDEPGAQLVPSHFDVCNVAGTGTLIEMPSKAVTLGYFVKVTAGNLEYEATCPGAGGPQEARGDGWLCSDQGLVFASRFEEATIVAFSEPQGDTYLFAGAGESQCNWSVFTPQEAIGKLRASAASLLQADSRNFVGLKNGADDTPGFVESECDERSLSDGEGKDGEGKDGEGKDGEGKDGEGEDGEGEDGEGEDGEGRCYYPLESPNDSRAEELLADIMFDASGGFDGNSDGESPEFMTGGYAGQKRPEVVSIEVCTVPIFPGAPFFCSSGSGYALTANVIATAGHILREVHGNQPGDVVRNVTVTVRWKNYVTNNVYTVYGGVPREPAVSIYNKNMGGLPGDKSYDYGILYLDGEMSQYYRSRMYSGGTHPPKFDTHPDWEHALITLFNGYRYAYYNLMAWPSSVKSYWQLDYPSNVVLEVGDSGGPFGFMTGGQNTSLGHPNKFVVDSHLTSSTLGAGWLPAPLSTNFWSWLTTVATSKIADCNFNNCPTYTSGGRNYRRCLTGSTCN